MPFTVVEDFWSKETNSMYCAGMTYRAGELLIPVVNRWVSEGLATWGAFPGLVKGAGTVESAP